MKTRNFRLEYGLSASLKRAPGMRASVSADAGAWHALDTELDRWAEMGERARFWWRDDDLEHPGPQLDRLLSASKGTPISLAVIPRNASRALAKRLAREDGVRVLQHGFAHADHAPPGDKKSEFPACRDISESVNEISAGQCRLKDLFPGLLLPVFVPPWNRIAPAVVEELSDLGFVALSTFSDARYSAIDTVNTHIDPIDWRGTREFSGAGTVLNKTVSQLERRRRARDFLAPLGLLTHHKVMDETGWRFVTDYLTVIKEHPGAKFAPLSNLLPAEASPR